MGVCVDSDVLLVSGVERIVGARATAAFGVVVEMTAARKSLLAELWRALLSVDPRFNGGDGRVGDGRVGDLRFVGERFVGERFVGERFGDWFFLSDGIVLLRSLASRLALTGWKDTFTQTETETTHVGLT